MSKCPTCGSTAPHMHPSVQHEGEVEVCAHSFHLTPTPQNRPEYIRAVHEKRERIARMDVPAPGMIAEYPCL